MICRTAKLSRYLATWSKAPSSIVLGPQRISKLGLSSSSLGSDAEDNSKNDEDVGVFADKEEFMAEKFESLPQGVDPRKGWNFRGVHKAIICGTVRQTPVQKLLRNGRTLTIFTVGTGGMFDNRTLSTNKEGLPRPAQWHRIVVHNEQLGAYAVQQLTKSSSVYVEGDIELRVYNRGISGEVVKLPEICVRQNGRIRLIKNGESISKIDMEEFQKIRFTL